MENKKHEHAQTKKNLYRMYFRSRIRISPMKGTLVKGNYN